MRGELGVKENSVIPETSYLLRGDRKKRTDRQILRNIYQQSTQAIAS